MFKSLGTTELLIIGAIVVLLFGGKKIPEFFRGLSDAVHEFKKSSKEDEDKPKKED